MATFYSDDRNDGPPGPRLPIGQLAPPASGPADEFLNPPASFQEIARASSRELRTCVSIIAGWTELLSRGLLVDQEIGQACAKIRQACSRIARTTERLEDFGVETPDAALDEHADRS